MHTKVIAAVAATLFSMANAHFFIDTPSPIPGSNPKDPLDPTGGNFPCHGADLTKGTVTQMAVGSSQPLVFDLGGGANTAVHGGGSCQISIAYSTDPATLKSPSAWKVIHSFVGGCPTNAKGNLNTAVACAPGQSGECVNQDFTFTIPPEVQNGNAILAWTWFNNIGNREMYMNCAKVSITGGSNQLSSLPNMLVANVGNGCASTETFSIQFPNPGKYVTTDSQLNYPLKAPVGSCGSTGSTPASSSGGSSSGSGSGSGAAAPSAAAPSAAAPSKGSNPGGTFAEGASPTTLATQAVAAPTPAAAPAAAAPAAGNSGTCTNGAIACSTPGFYCISETTFAECSWGCAIPMQVAAGTKCSGNGIVAARRLAARSVPRRHLVSL